MTAQMGSSPFVPLSPTRSAVPSPHTRRDPGFHQTTQRPPHPVVLVLPLRPRDKHAAEIMPLVRPQHYEARRLILLGLSSE